MVIPVAVFGGNGWIFDMRKIQLTVGATALRDQPTWAYPNGGGLGTFATPVYQLSASGVDDVGGKSSRIFEVLRFGVQCEDRKTARVVGLADNQTHVIKRWIPDYDPHSFVSNEIGAWQVYGSFLIHDGPDTVREVSATIGCVEIMGNQGFIDFNDFIISLSGAKAASRDDKLKEIGNSGKLSIHYLPAKRPPLKKWAAP